MFITNFSCYVFYSCAKLKSSVIAIGWADQFLITPAEGLEDKYISMSAKVAGGKAVIVYHDYSTASLQVTSNNDLGSEVNVLYTRKFNKHYYVGVKYAHFSADDSHIKTNDVEKAWVWLGAKF